LEIALEHYRQATQLEPNDASAWREIGEILEARDEHAAAGEAYRQALGIEPSADIRDRINRLQGLLALARQPVNYRRIPESPAITRGELAALVGVHFEQLLDQTGQPEAAVVTDTREHWAASWIFAVTRTGVMDVYPNHTFQPDSIVRRSDLAQAVSQLLSLLSQQSPVLAEKWKTAQPEIADVDAGNLNYAAISVAIESGVLPLLEGSTFQLSRSVSGAEAVAAMERLEQLLR
jgi:tetratricopeptide (TPR) repeat protein